MKRNRALYGNSRRVIPLLPLLNWYAAESVDIQEGNLLRAVTKIQRMKKSSDFIKGVLFLDLSLDKRGHLIEFGSKIDPSLIDKDLSQIKVKDSAFFEQYVMMPLPKNPQKVLVFLIQSQNLRNLFLWLSLILCVVFGIFQYLILKNRNAEVQKRESVIKEALNELLTHGKASAVLEKEHSALVSWWSQKKTEYDLAQENLAKTKIQVLFAQMAAQVAHDIRSPLGALKSAIENLCNNKQVDHDNLKFAAARLTSITEDLIENRSQALLKTHTANPDPSGHAPLVPLGNTTELVAVLQNLFKEKESLCQHMTGLSFQLNIPSLSYEAVCFDPNQIARHISNLIDNSIDAIPLQGQIFLKVEKLDQKFIFEIKDSGSGIPEAILERFGELGNTSKSNGSGMGIHHTMQYQHRIEWVT